MFTLTLIAMLLLFSYLYETITGSSSGTVANICIISAIVFASTLLLYTIIIYFAKLRKLSNHKISRLPGILVTTYTCVLITMGYVAQVAKISDSTYKLFEGIAIVLLAILIITYWVLLFVNIKKHNSNVFLILPLLVIEEIKGFVTAFAYGLFIGIFFALIM